MYFQQGENVVYQHFLPQSPALGGGEVLSTSAGPSTAPKIAMQRQVSPVQPGKPIHLQMDQWSDEGEDSSQFINSNSTMELEKNTDTGVTAAHPRYQLLPVQAVAGTKNFPKKQVFVEKYL